METKFLNALAAMTDIDDDLVLEGLETLSPAKERKPFSAYIKYFAAAAAALILTGGILLAVASFGKKPAEPEDHSAFVPPIATEPEPIPDETDAPGMPTYHMTPDPTFAPEMTDEPEPVETPAPTPQATLPPDETASPSAVPTPPENTQTPRPTAAPTAPVITPTPSVSAAPTSEPPADMLSFSSLEAFLSAVRGHADPLLDGIDCYYTHEGALTAVTVDRDAVFYEYLLDDGTPLTVEWIRDVGYSERLFNYFVENFDGEWYGELYLVRTQAGVMFGYTLDNGHMLRMHGSGIRTVEQALEQYAPVRHAI